MHEQIIEYLREVSRNPVPFDTSTDLIENRVIDSLQFVEFVLFIQEISGEAIDLDRVSVDDFRSIETIEKRFFRKAPL